MNNRAVIAETLNQVLNDHGACTGHEFQDSTRLLDTGLDSLGFAVLIAKLDSTFGFDPFLNRDQFIFPVYFVDLVKAYEEHGI